MRKFVTPSLSLQSGAIKFISTEVFVKTKGDSQDEWHISWEWELQALSSPTGILSQIFFGLVAESIWPLVVILRQWP